MEKPKNKYILHVDRVGKTVKRNILPIGPPTPMFSPESFFVLKIAEYVRAWVTPTPVLRQGELLEALPEAEQPSGFQRIALVGIERESLGLECPTADVTPLSDEEANLLLAISSLGERYKTFIDRERVDFGRRLSPESQVFVSVTKHLPGVVWYKSELPFCPGTMFGVELIVCIN